MRPFDFIRDLKSIDFIATLIPIDFIWFVTWSYARYETSQPLFGAGGKILA
jgi:hypothetical protein